MYLWLYENILRVLKIKQDSSLIETLLCEFQDPTLVYLHILKYSKTLQTRRVKKLSPSYCGPYQIDKRIGSSTYQLELLSYVHAHLMRHVDWHKQVLGVFD